MQHARHLFAWEGDVLVGRFDKQGDKTTFEYAGSPTHPISLSLPCDGSWDFGAPAAFLDGLLPESASDRLYMQQSLNAASTDTFDLLNEVDSTGGLVFSLSDTPPELVVQPNVTAIASDLDIEAQMQRVFDSGDDWWGRGGCNRFSLTGKQGKFSLTRLGNVWLWPNATLPSTHIIKPNGKRVLGVASFEHATLELASRLGIKVAHTEVVRYGERIGLCVERFDRVVEQSHQTIRRPRTEDLTQAMGAWNRDKYDFEISDLVHCLRKANVDERVCYDLVRQIAFNACVGNHDAHAKNYSIFLDETGVRLTPLYDAISMAPWPEFKNDVLAMPINDVYDPWEVTMQDWRAEAVSCGLDADLVEKIVVEIEGGLRTFDYGTLPCDGATSLKIRDYVYECGRDLQKA